LTETGGSTGATIKAIELDFENGPKATFGPEVAESTRIGPGATVQVSGLKVAGTRASRALSLQIRVLITGDNGADNITGAAVSIIATYRLSGRITDEATSRPVPNAVITVTFGRASGRSATSDGAGNYVLHQIPVGSVAFNVSAAGYSTVTKTANISADTTVDVALPRPR
jgi:hypothetical protein